LKNAAPTGCWDAGENVSPRALEIYNDADGVPHVRDRAHLRLSLSHSAACALCACIVVNPSSGGALLGADLEHIEPRANSLVRDYFTPPEQARVNTAVPAARDTVATALWSAKEAALKAIQKGLSIDTRAVEVMLAPFQSPPHAWTPLEIHFQSDERNRPPLRGWWRVHDAFVLTLATNADSHPQPY
jgi:4'-phosphopantetheinyl transferase